MLYYLLIIVPSILSSFCVDNLSVGLESGYRQQRLQYTSIDEDRVIGWKNMNGWQNLLKATVSSELGLYIEGDLSYTRIFERQKCNGNSTFAELMLGYSFTWNCLTFTPLVSYVYEKDHIRSHDAGTFVLSTDELAQMKGFYSTRFQGPSLGGKVDTSWNDWDLSLLGQYIFADFLGRSKWVIGSEYLHKLRQKSAHAYGVYLKASILYNLNCKWKLGLVGDFTYFKANRASEKGSIDLLIDNDVHYHASTKDAIMRAFAVRGIVEYEF
jgi:hypothetical protein